MPTRYYCVERVDVDIKVSSKRARATNSENGIAQSAGQVA